MDFEKAKKKFVEGLQSKATKRIAEDEAYEPTLKAPPGLYRSGARPVSRFFTMHARLKNSPAYKKQSGGHLFPSETPIGKKFHSKYFGGIK